MRHVNQFEFAALSCCIGLLPWVTGHYLSPGEEGGEFWGIVCLRGRGEGKGKNQSSPGEGGGGHKNKTEP